jgi:hypothetical protein
MATVVVAIVIVAVFSALIALNHFSGTSLITSEPGVTQPSSSSTHAPNTETVNTTLASTSMAVPSQCSGTRPPSSRSYEFPIGTVFAGTGSPAIICLQLYYFAASPETFNVTGALSIMAQQSAQGGRQFNGEANFTVIASQAQVVIGGPTDENEGTVVAYAVTAKPGASGTYELNFLPPGGPNRWLISSNDEPLGCPYYGALVAGNAQPDYVLGSSCLTISTTEFSSSSATVGGTSYHMLTGVLYALIDGDIYFSVFGVTNSTE